jgi:hypothetical protein
MNTLSFGFIIFALTTVAARAQQTTTVPNCAGTNDTTEFTRIIATIGANTDTIKLPRNNALRCAASKLTIPANITLDNTDGAGIAISTGQTLTILGNIVNPSGKQIFFNALSGQGTVSFSGNKYLSVVHPEWWGAKSISDDAPALNACSAAAATLIAADIDLVNTYNLGSTWQVGAGTPFTSITLKGHGAGSSGTTLNWVGPANGVMVKFWANKFSNIERIRFQNTVSLGSTVGVRLSGPGTGTQSNGYNIDNCVISGFFYGLQAGDPSTTAASSELSFRNVAFDGNGTGFLGTSTGNTLVITFLNCSFANNKAVGLDLGSSGDCHIFGGAFGGNGTDIAGTGWTNTLSLIGVRFELVHPEVALSAGGIATVVVRNCTFVANPSQLPTNAIIRGATSLTLENNFVGGPGESWKFYDFGTGDKGSNHQFVATSNIVRGTMLYIEPENGAVDGLITLIDGVRGEVVWPNLIPDTIAGQARLTAGVVPVRLTKRRNTNYSISLSSDADETLHFANKSVDGFDIVSSDKASTAHVTWSVAKQ